MFERSLGMFHLVFADRNDSYYSDSLIKMGFVPYLRFCLARQGYRYIYIVSEGCRDPSKSYTFQYVGSQSKMALEVKKAFGFKFFGGEKKTSEEIDFKVEKTELNKEELFELFDNILSFSRRKEQVALVVPISVFNNYASRPSALAALTEIKKGGLQCAVVITTSLSAEDNDKYFLDKALCFSGEKDKNESVFFNADLFPEVTAAFDKGEDTEKSVFTYCELKHKLGAKMNVFNSLSYKTLFNALQYELLRNGNPAAVACADECAAVVWAWHNSEVFRNKYIIEFSDNPYRQTNIILNDVAKSEIFSRIMEIAMEEKIVDITEFLNRYKRFDEMVYVRYSPNLAGKAFRTFCAAARGKMPQSAEPLYRNVLQSAPLFELASFPSAGCNTIPPHFDLQRYNDSIALILDSLKEDWNAWQTAAATIFAQTLIMLAAVMKEKTSVDSGNILSSQKLELAIINAEYCAKMQAAHQPWDNAQDICERTLAVLRLNDEDFSGSYDKVKQELFLAKERRRCSEL